MTNVGVGFDAMVWRDKEACQRSYDALLKIRGEWATVTIDRLLGMLSLAIGDVSKAVEHLEDSLAFCARTGHIPEYAWTCLSYAAVLLDARVTGPPPGSGAARKSPPNLHRLGDATPAPAGG